MLKVAATIAGGVRYNPVGQGDVLEVGAPEYFAKLQLGVADFLT
jgi:hypothetical protein